MEHHIITRINDDIKIMLKVHTKLLNEMSEIKTLIGSTDNTYFIENKTLLEHIGHLFTCLHTTNNALHMIKESTAWSLNNLCVHTWVHDDIDTGLEHEQSQHIIYCSKCEISKK